MTGKDCSRASVGVTLGLKRGKRNWKQDQGSPQEKESDAGGIK